MIAGLLFDKQDQELIESNSWHLSSHGYPRNSKLGYLHRVIMQAKPGDIIDHINGSKLDARRNNLRKVSRSENLRNLHGPTKANRVGILRVHYEQQTGKYRGQAMIEGKRLSTRRYETAEAARRALEELYRG